MIWRLSYRADPAGKLLADRHYNRQNPNSPQFVPPGRCVVLVSTCRRALWVTSWPDARYVKHAWAGAWINSLFRNEGAGLSSELIREAVAITRGIFGEPPALGMVTFVDADKTAARRSRHVQPGECYRRAGFTPCGMTKGRLYALRLAPGDMPGPLVLAEAAA